MFPLPHRSTPRVPIARHRLFACAVAALAALTLTACRHSDAGPVDPRWSTLISARTQGAISKRDRITITFNQDVAGEYMVGRPTSGLLVLEPEVEGVATFVSARELVFAPAADLPSGQSFQATLPRSGLLDLPEDLADYRFSFQVIAQHFEVEVHGVGAESGDEDDLVLTGAVVTADFAGAEAVESVLRAAQDGADLEMRWQHDDDGLNHRFAVQGIARGERDGVVRLRWSGRAIGVGDRGTRNVTIPRREAFRVTSVRAESDDRQYVQVRFSDPLDPAQNLNGMVSLGDERITLEVAGNVLRVIPADRVVGPATIALEEGILSAGGKRLEERGETEVIFVDIKPGVRFAGRGVVLPRADRLTVPIEAANVHSVQVTALRVYESNIGQFLQANDLSGGRELNRTGRTLWQRTVDLPVPPDGGWTRYAVDVSDLVRAYQGSLVRLTLSIDRDNSTFACGAERDVAEEPDWRDRNDPCTDAYFLWSPRVDDSRNFLASNIGMTAKRDARGGILVATTDLRTSEPMRGVSVMFMDYQNQPLGTVVTGAGGLARATVDEAPHYAVAEYGADKGYLKMNPGSALPTSHFDVGGEVMSEGLKGAIYGERGVWRPGDDIHLTFVLDDADNPLPEDHPATLRLVNPMGQVVHTATNSEPVGDFYPFTLGTAADAPTGNWNAAVEVGGARFTTPVRIETVMPNRLKVDLDLGGGELLHGGAPHEATLVGQWLSGAVARNLDADVEVTFRPAPTAFTRFSDYAFDDPARDYAAEPVKVFDGSLDEEGLASFTTELAPGGHSPGMLTATFTTRIFEQGGAFSTNRRSARFSPYDRYVGIRPPPATRGAARFSPTRRTRSRSRPCRPAANPSRPIRSTSPSTGSTGAGGGTARRNRWRASPSRSTARWWRGDASPRRTGAEAGTSPSTNRSGAATCCAHATAKEVTARGRPSTSTGRVGRGVPARSPARARTRSACSPTRRTTTWATWPRFSCRRRTPAARS